MNAGSVVYLVVPLPVRETSSDSVRIAPYGDEPIGESPHTSFYFFACEAANPQTDAQCAGDHLYTPMTTERFPL
ncbi:hypothetical protein BH24ACT5_BH24ACT5_02350 [soil metagenome]